MPTDRKLFQHVLTMLPPAAIAAGTWIVRAKCKPLTFNSESALGALCFAFAISLIFSTRLLHRKSDAGSKHSWFDDLDIVIMPLVALEVAVGALAVGWLLGSIIALLDFRDTGMSSTRLILPACAAAVALCLGRLQTRPTLIQRIWKLADARNGESKLEAIYRAAKDSNDLTTLHAIAKMPRMFSAILENLAGHSDSEIRTEVANNPRSPAPLLNHLAQDKSIDVRRAIAFNRAASVEVLRLLARDADEAVREKAMSRLHELEASA